MTAERLKTLRKETVLKRNIARSMNLRILFLPTVRWWSRGTPMLIRLLRRVSGPSWRYTVY